MGGNGKRAIEQREVIEVILLSLKAVATLILWIFTTTKPLSVSNMESTISLDIHKQQYDVFQPAEE